MNVKTDAKLISKPIIPYPAGSLFGSARNQMPTNHLRPLSAQNASMPTPTKVKTFQKTSRLVVPGVL
jgi:hypothetical protein